MLLMSLANLIWGKYGPAIPPDADATRHTYALAYNFSRLSQPRFLSLVQRALCAAAILRRAAADIVRLGCSRRVGQGDVGLAVLKRP